MMDSVGEQENRDLKSPNQRSYCSESQDSQDDSQDEDPAEACTALQTSEDEETTIVKMPNTPVRRPLDRLQPKKRWLREACLEQQLAKPLRWEIRPTPGSNNITTEMEQQNISVFDSPISGWSPPDINVNSTIVSDESTNLRRESLHPPRQISWNLVAADNANTGDTNNVEQIVFDSTSTLPQQVHWDPVPSNIVNSVTNDNSSINDDASTKKTFTNYWDNAKNDSRDNQTITTELTNTETVAIAARHTENETRPTVLMLAGNIANSMNNKESGRKELSENVLSHAKVVVVRQDESMINLPIPEDNQKWLGALALMELAKTQQEAARALEFAKNREHNATEVQTMNYTHL